jgi:hypothetical protein
VTRGCPGRLGSRRVRTPATRYARERTHADIEIATVFGPLSFAIAHDNLAGTGVGWLRRAAPRSETQGKQGVPSHIDAGRGLRDAAGLCPPIVKVIDRETSSRRWLLICAGTRGQALGLGLGESCGAAGGGWARCGVGVVCARAPSLISVHDPGLLRVGDMMVDRVIPLGEALRPLCL